MKILFREIKEMDTLIDKLSSTLKAVNNLSNFESEFDEAKDIVDEDQEDTFTSEKIKGNNVENKSNRMENKQNNSSDTNDIEAAGDNDTEDLFFNRKNSNKKQQMLEVEDNYSKKTNEIRIQNMCATNHMTHRINSLEK